MVESHATLTLLQINDVWPRERHDLNRTAYDMRPLRTWVSYRLGQDSTLTSRRHVRRSRLAYVKRLEGQRV